MAKDVFNLQRFIDAQAPVYDRVLAELRAGHKRSHWMWFIFPQIEGLGSSEMAAYYAIASREEAAVYLAHNILGPRLTECTELVLHVGGTSVEKILDYPDDLKFHSSMTLFARVSAPGSVFHQALAKYFGGKEDEGTVSRL